MPLIRCEDLVTLIIRDRFDPIIEKVINVLQTHGASSVTEIKSYTDLPVEKVKEVLCILIKHKLVSFEPCESSDNNANYNIRTENALCIPFYPQYTIMVKLKFGDKCEMMVEELLWNGYSTVYDIILKVAEKFKCHLEDLPRIKDEFVSLVVAKYIERINLADGHPVKVFQVADQKAAPPQIDMKVISQIFLKKISLNEISVNEYWSVNFDRFHQDIRDQCVVDAFTRRIDSNAGEFVKVLIQQMYIRTDPWAESSNPVPLVEIKQISRKKVSFPHLVTFFDQYAEIIEKDQYNMISRAGEANGGALQIHMKTVFTVLAWEIVENVVKQKFDSKAHRIFRLVKEKEFVDPEKLQQLVMIPSKDAKRISFQLVQEKFFKVKEFKVGNINQYMLYIDFSTVVLNVLRLSFKSLHNLMSRRQHLYNTNKRLIEKKKRCDILVMMLKAQQATEEQIADVEENITPPEREIVGKTEKHLKMLNFAELEMNSTIFMLQMFLKYKFQKMTYK